MIKSGLNCLCIPSPWQSGQAPSGELNEKTRGESSGIKAPCSGQAKSSDHDTVSPSLCTGRLFPSSSSGFEGARKLVTARAPPPKRNAFSTLSVVLCRRSLERMKRSIRTSISWRIFLSSVGGFSKSTSCPLTRPCIYPCSTNCLNNSTCVPFLARTTGLQTAMVCCS